MKATFCAGVFRENPGSDSGAQLILPASAGRAKGRAALLLRIFRDFKVQHFNSEQNLKVPRLPAFILPCLSPSPRCFSSRRRPKGTFPFGQVHPALKLADPPAGQEEEKGPRLLFWGPLLHSCSWVHPATQGHPCSPGATVSSW